MKSFLEKFFMLYSKAKQYSEDGEFETYPWYLNPFYLIHMFQFSNVKILCIFYTFHFRPESELTSSASPMLVFYSIFNEALLPSENVLPLTQC